MLRIPYTHSDPLTLALTLDKNMAKRVVAAAGVATPRAVVLEGAASALDHGLGFPVIAKPLFEGSSMGIRAASRVETAPDLHRLVGRLLQDYGQPVLVEEFCPGPEYTVGVLGTGAGARVLAVMEIAPRHVPPGDFVYSLEVKRDFENQVEYVVPPRRAPEVLRAVERLALQAYRALGCRDIGRVDVRTAADGEPQFLEVNPLPGLNPRSADVAIMARRIGVGYEELIGAIVRGACERQGLVS
jgi:D-alanine-D-alanine ligase